MPTEWPGPQLGFHFSLPADLHLRGPDTQRSTTQLPTGWSSLPDKMVAALAVQRSRESGSCRTRMVSEELLPGVNCHRLADHPQVSTLRVLSMILLTIE